MHFWQNHIHQNQIRLMLTGKCDSLLPWICHDNMVVFRFQTKLEDGDSDGIGNICDADLNNDCVVNAIDLGLFKTVYQTSDETADFNGDGLVDDDDLQVMRSGFFKPPGPSGSMTACACRPPEESLSAVDGGFGVAGQTPRDRPHPD